MPSPHDRASERSIERAQHDEKQRLRIFGHAVLQQLDSETELAIEVNGVAVGLIACMDSALAELAAGWTFIHRFCESPLDFNRANASDNRASVMVRGGVDILHRRGVMHGERQESPRVPDPWPRQDEWSVPEDVLLDILREAWQLFRNDRMLEGSVHAALASSSGIEVVAFDITAQNAVAKVLGWCLQSARFPSYEILVVNGLVTMPMVDAAARLGVLIIATPHVPTADAYKAARIAGMNIVGYMRQETAGLFGSPGLVTFDDPADADT